MAYTIKDAMILCGPGNNKLFSRLTPAARFVVEIFIYDLSYFTDTIYE